MNLYEIDQAIQDLVDPESGELKDYEAFEKLQLARDEKLENTALFIKNLMAEAKAIKEEEKSLKERRVAAENKAERMKEYLFRALDGEKFKTARCSVSYQKSTALEVDDAVAAAEWLDANGHVDLVVYSAPTIDKRAVSDLIRGGKEIPGASVVERVSMTVR